MLFNSINFLIFFPVAVLSYYIVTYKIRYIWLLAVSYLFYYCFNPSYVVLLAASTAITYVGGLLLSKSIGKESGEEQGTVSKKTIWAKVIVAFSFLTHLGMLFFFKYFDFVLGNLFAVINAVNPDISKPGFNLLLPAGISFYTFKALSYIMDVYRGDMKAERNPLKYGLYLSFFPQLAAGPIERAFKFLKQLEEKHRFNFNQVRDGVLLMLWGFFQKLVIADRVAILVNQTFDYYDQYSGLQIMVAVLFYAVQIYCDFSGYSNIAIGASQVLGFNLMTNFETPYLSKSVSEFWRRWHISLSSWFRDYLYIPLGGNRLGKKKKYRNIMIVFVASGLWHGASWHYVIWGGLNGIYQIIGAELMPVRKWLCKKADVHTDVFSHKLLKTIITFLLICLSWVFFRARDTKSAVLILIKMFENINIGMIFDGSLYKMNLNAVEFWIAVGAIVVLLAVSVFKYKGVRIRAKLAEQGIWFRFLAYLGIIFAILIFGIYGPGFNASEFIYFKY